MANTIKLKNGTGAPTGGDLAAREVAVDNSTGQMYSSTNGSDITKIGIDRRFIPIAMGMFDPINNVAIGTQIGCSVARVTAGTPSDGFDITLDTAVADADEVVVAATTDNLNILLGGWLNVEVVDTSTIRIVGVTPNYTTEDQQKALLAATSFVVYDRGA